MAHQGEDIKFTVKGDDNINLDALNFAVTVYLHCTCDNPKSKKTLYKNQHFQAVIDESGNNTNTYVGTIPSSDTAAMEEGQYNMELLTITEGGERSIFQQKHAFVLECSVSKSINFE